MSCIGYTKEPITREARGGMSRRRFLAFEILCELLRNLPLFPRCQLGFREIRLALRNLAQERERIQIQLFGDRYLVVRTGRSLPARVMESVLNGPIVPKAFHIRAVWLRLSGT